MPELETQIRRYARDVVEQAPRVTADEVLDAAARPVARRLPVPVRRPLLAAAALVGAVALVIGTTVVVRDRAPTGVVIGPTAEAPIDPAVVASWGGPADLAVSDDAVWVGMGPRTSEGEDGPPSGPGGIVRLDRTTFETVGWAEVDALHSLAYDDGSLWATGFTTNAVTRVDAATGRTVAEIPLPELADFDDGAFLPGPVAASKASVWTTTARGYAARIDPAADEVATLYQLTPDAPGAVVAHGEDAWVSQAQEGVTRLAAMDTAAGPTFPLTIDGHATVVGEVVLTGDELWVTATVLANPGRFSDADTGAIVRFDPTSMTPSLIAAIPEPVRWLAPADGRMWTASSSHTPSAMWSVAMDASGQVAAERSQHETPAVVSALAGDGRYLWLTDPENRSIVRLDARTGELRSIGLPGRAVTPPKGPPRRATQEVDVDGDGQADRVGIMTEERARPATTTHLLVVTVETGSGQSLTLEIGDVSSPGRPEILGHADLGRDGRDEVFVLTGGETAARIALVAFDPSAKELRHVAIAGEDIDLLAVGNGNTFAVGVTCLGDGSLEWWRWEPDDHQDQSSGTIHRRVYRLNGATLDLVDESRTTTKRIAGQLDCPRATDPGM